jgi:hypothetical protein
VLLIIVTGVVEEPNPEAFRVAAESLYKKDAVVPEAVASEKPNPLLPLCSAGVVEKLVMVVPLDFLSAPS